MIYLLYVFEFDPCDTPSTAIPHNPIGGTACFLCLLNFNGSQCHRLKMYTIWSNMSVFMFIKPVFWLYLWTHLNIRTWKSVTELLNISGFRVLYWQFHTHTHTLTAVTPFGFLKKKTNNCKGWFWSEYKCQTISSTRRK